MVNLGANRLYRHFIGHGGNPVFPVKTAGADGLSPAPAHGFAAITSDSGNYDRRSLFLKFYRGRVAFAQPEPFGLTLAVTFTPADRLL